MGVIAHHLPPSKACPCADVYGTFSFEVTLNRYSRDPSPQIWRKDRSTRLQWLREYLFIFLENFELKVLIICAQLH